MIMVNCCVLAIIVVDLLIKEESIFFAFFAHYFLHCYKENPES